MLLSNRPPVADECTLDRLEISGLMPPGLRGTLYRNGPNPQNPDPALHWFFGEGMLHAFHVRDGQVAYRNRWLHTDIWAQNAGLPAENLPGGVANTSIITAAGRLLALEEAHMPVRVDPDNLATLGTEDFGGSLPAGPFTAHPKLCPRTGNLLFFGYGAEGFFADTIRLGEVTPDGGMVWHANIHAPYAAMIHDFAVTERFIAIPLFPLVLDLEQGGFVWQPQRGSFLGVIDRARGPDSLRWLPLEGGFAFHVANAWDEDGQLIIDLMLSEVPPFFPGPPGNDAAFLTRWSIDLSTDTPPLVVRHRLSTTDGEFPRIDERRAGLRNRNIYWSAHTALYARDDATGVERHFTLPEGDSTSEPVFVPRGTADGDGWLVSVFYRAATATSDLAILDAADLAAGPVALARLPVRVPDGFHGSWVGEAA